MDDFPHVAGDFPKDFSIFATFRTSKKAKAYLFSMFNGNKKPARVLGLEVSNKPKFYFEDQFKQPGKASPTFNVKNMADGK